MDQYCILIKMFFTNPSIETIEKMDNFIKAYIYAFCVYCVDKNKGAIKKARKCISLIELNNKTLMNKEEKIYQKSPKSFRSPNLKMKINNTISKGKMAQIKTMSDLVGKSKKTSEFCTVENERTSIECKNPLKQERTSKYNESKLSMSITFGDQAENHAGMQKIGNRATSGIEYKELKLLYKSLIEKGKEVEFVKLHPFLPKDKRSENEAGVLVIRNGVKTIFGIESKDLLAEQTVLEPDKKAFMKGRVVNKHARYNLCYGDEKQSSDYTNKKGTIIPFSEVPLLKEIRDKMDSVFGEKTRNLVGELNAYYDTSICGIGYHGDSERRIVVCIRLGRDNPLCYYWYIRGVRVSNRITLNIKNGDIYIMSSKAVGTDWKKSSILTLRHAAGCEKFIK